MTKNEIMERLTGQKLNSVMSLAETVVFTFGDTVNLEGMERVEFTVMIRTSWRLLKNGRLMTGKADLYAPYERAAVKRSADPMSQECQSVFDAQLEDVQRELEGASVEAVEITDNSDIRITFDNGIVLETFITLSRHAEFWKFIDAVSDTIECFYEEQEDIQQEWAEFLQEGGMPPNMELN